MFKTLLSVLVLAQLCILGVNAAHYIAFAITTGTLRQPAGICIQNDQGLLMRDHGFFGSGVKNYGFHKDGMSANVNWDNRNVDVQGWGIYGFQDFQKDWNNQWWQGCWESVGPSCSQFQAKASKECESYFRSTVWGF